MSRPNRRVLFCVALLLALAAGVAGYLHIQFHGPTGAAARHTDRYLYERDTVARVGGEKDAVYRYFFATNRSAENPWAPGEGRFGRERDDAVKFGAFDVRIQKRLGLGLLVDPVRWLQANEMRVRKVETMPRTAAAEAIRAQVAASGSRSLLIVIPGRGESFPAAIRQTAFVAHVLNIDTPVLVFDWPGDQGRSFSGHEQARSVADASGKALADVIRLAVEEIAPDRLWLLADGLGARVAAAAVPALTAVESLADADTEFEDVVLAGPDLAPARLAPEVPAGAQALVGKLTVYAATSEQVRWLTRADGGRRAGGTRGDRPDAAARTSSLDKPGSSARERVAIVNATPEGRKQASRGISYQTPAFFEDLYLRLAGPDTPDSSRKRPYVTTDGADLGVRIRHP